MIENLTAEGEKVDKPYGYGWYATVAAQRIVGIPPQMFKAARTELRTAQKRPKAITGEQQPLIDEQRPVSGDPQWSRDLVKDVEQRKGGKRA